MKKQNDVSICFALDDNYLWPFLVSVFSAKVTAPETNRICIIYDPKSLKYESIVFIKSCLDTLNINAHFIESKVDVQYRNSNHISKSAFLRINLPIHLEGTILYVDCDIVFMQGWTSIFGVAKLFEREPEALAARKHWGEMNSEKNRSIIESKDRYFNSGVLLIHHGRWLENSYAVKAQEAMLGYNKLGFEWADQCVLNWIFKGDYFEIKQKYNTVPAEFKRKRTKILHFAGSVKPWRYGIDVKSHIFIQKKAVELNDLQDNQKEAFVHYSNIEQKTLNFLLSRGLLVDGNSKNDLDL